MNYFCLKHMPTIWKIVTEVIMLPKLGKLPIQAQSYRSISLLMIISKLFEKLFLKKLRRIIKTKNLIPNHQFGFLKQHSRIYQVHSLISVIECLLEEKQVCSTIFLNGEKAFDRVWHEGLMDNFFF